MEADARLDPIDGKAVLFNSSPSVPIMVFIFSVNKTTPLHLAASNGHAEMVKLLLDNGADVTAEDTLSRNPLEKAIIKRQRYFFIDSVAIKYLFLIIVYNLKRLCRNNIGSQVLEKCNENITSYG